MFRVSLYTEEDDQLEITRIEKYSHQLKRLSYWPFDYPVKSPPGKVNLNYK